MEPKSMEEREMCPQGKSSGHHVILGKPVDAA
jgi:hypothetical protein